jgi:hypothetical protein
VHWNACKDIALKRQASSRKITHICANEKIAVMMFADSAIDDQPASN